MAATLLGLAAGSAGVVAAADPPPGLTAGGLATPGVQWVANLPLGAVAEGGRLVGDTFFATANGRGLVSVDASDPARPRVLDTLPLAHLLENEDLATDGDIALLSVGSVGDVAAQAAGQRLPDDTGAGLWVVDVSDPSDLRTTTTAPLAGAGDHVVTCLLSCTWAWSNSGKIIDLRDPAKPTLLEQRWTDVIREKHEKDEKTFGPHFPGHALTEVRPGVVLTASEPSLLLDARDPTRPRLLGTSDGSVGTYHNVGWPREGHSRWILGVNEPGPAQFPLTCRVREAGRSQAPEALRPYFESALTLYDARDWQNGTPWEPVDRWYPSDGVVLDGARPVSTRGCGAHWFDVHPTFDRDGGLVAQAAYDHGTRLLEVLPEGRLVERGWFLPHGGSTSAAYWIDERTLWTVDLERGIDVLEVDPAVLADERTGSTR